jgi:hypothetical protein
MTVADLLATRKEPWEHKLCEGRVIALDAMNGKVIFDTWKNTRKHIEKFFDGEVSALWGDVVVKEAEFTSRVCPVLKCYVTHDSWKGGAE